MIDKVQPSPLVGDIVKGRYRLEELIREDRFAWTFMAQHIVIDSLHFALKIIKAEHTHAADFRGRFETVMKTAAQLKGRNSVRLFDHGFTATGLPFIATELLRSISLADLLRRDTQVSPAQTTVIALGLARGLAEAHKLGLAHFSLQPSKILITQPRDENEPVAMLLDQGLMLTLGGQSGALAGTNPAGVLLPTDHYRAPEQLRGEGSWASDLYSLAYIMAEMLDGAAPYSGLSSGQFSSQVILDEPVPIGPVTLSSPLGLIVLRALSKSPSERFKSADELVDALNDVWLDMRGDVDLSALRVSLVLPPNLVQAPGLQGQQAASGRPEQETPQSTPALHLFDEPSREDDPPSVTVIMQALAKEDERVSRDVPVVDVSDPHKESPLTPDPHRESLLDEQPDPEPGERQAQAVAAADPPLSPAATSTPSDAPEPAPAGPAASAEYDDYDDDLKPPRGRGGVFFVLFLLVIGGGGAWYWLDQQGSEEPAAEVAELDEPEEAAPAAPAPPAEVPAERIDPNDPFVRGRLLSGSRAASQAAAEVIARAAAVSGSRSYTIEADARDAVVWVGERSPRMLPIQSAWGVDDRPIEIRIEAPGRAPWSLTVSDEGSVDLRVEMSRP